MRKRLHVLGAAVAALLVAGVALAQSAVLIRDADTATTWVDVYGDGTARGTTPKGFLIMGDDGTNVQAVAVNSSGALVTTTSGSAATHGSCTNANTTVGASATAVPATALSGRATIAIALLTSGATLYCCSSSTACTTTTGLPIVFNGLYTDNLAAGTSVSCICSQAGCSVSSSECP